MKVLTENTVICDQVKECHKYTAVQHRLKSTVSKTFRYFLKTHSVNYAKYRKSAIFTDNASPKKKYVKHNLGKIVPQKYIH